MSSCLLFCSASWLGTHRDLDLPAIISQGLGSKLCIPMPCSENGFQIPFTDRWRPLTNHCQWIISETTCVPYGCEPLLIKESKSPSSLFCSIEQYWRWCIKTMVSPCDSVLERWNKEGAIVTYWCVNKTKQWNWQPSMAQPRAYVWINGILRPRQASCLLW